MSGERSYDPRDEGSGFTAELRRLAAQAAVSWSRELRVLRHLGLSDGMRVLDIGCGPGDVTAALARDLPAARIVALDDDAGLLALAADRARTDMTAIAGVRARADQLPLAGGRFDFVLARYVFQHLEQPGAAAREALRVLRPGGRLAIVDIDAALWGVAEPSFPEVAPVYAKMGRAQAGRGGNRLIGRRLHRILRDAGFADVQLDAFVYHSDDLGLAAFEPQLAPDRLAALHRRGIVSDDEMAIVRRAHEQFMQSPGAFVMMAGLVGSGVKP